MCLYLNFLILNLLFLFMVLLYRYFLQKNPKTILKESQIQELNQ